MDLDIWQTDDEGNTTRRGQGDGGVDGDLTVRSNTADLSAACIQGFVKQQDLDYRYRWPPGHYRQMTARPDRPSS